MQNALIDMLSLCDYVINHYVTWCINFKKLISLFITAVSSIKSENAIRDSIIKLPSPTVASTQQRCCICKDVKGREAMTKTALLDLFLKRKIFLPKSNRACGKHIVNRVFTAAALELIEPSQDSFQPSGIYF